MAPPTTLLELATLELATATANRDAAQAALQAAQADLAAATASSTALGGQLTALAADERATRDALAASPTEADGIVLLDHLKELTIQRRALEAQIVQANGRIELGRRATSAMQADLTATTADLAAATADVAAETSQADVSVAGSRAATVRDLGRTPVSSLPASATTALGSAAFRNAGTRVGTDIPADLLTRAQDRGDRQAARAAALRTAVDDARTALASALAATAGASGADAQKQDAFDRAVAAAQDLAQHGKERLDRATGLLPGINAAPALSAEAVAAIAAAAATSSLALEKARDDARADVDAKQAALDAARLAALAVDPDNVEGNAAVRSARTALRTATTALNNAERDYTQADRDAVDAWEAAVPDSSWRLLSDFTTAKRILDGLAASDPAGLATALAAAESDLAAARQADRKAGRTVAGSRAAVRDRSNAADAAAVTDSAQQFGALRGDG